jgi:hypothetical protein
MQIKHGGMEQTHVCGSTTNGKISIYYRYVFLEGKVKQIP